MAPLTPMPIESWCAGLPALSAIYGKVYLFHAGDDAVVARCMKKLAGARRVDAEWVLKFRTGGWVYLFNPRDHMILASWSAAGFATARALSESPDLATAPKFMGAVESGRGW